jgi:hypothetical protein
MLTVHSVPFVALFASHCGTLTVFCSPTIARRSLTLKKHSVSQVRCSEEDLNQAGH